MVSLNLDDLGQLRTGVRMTPTARGGKETQLGPTVHPAVSSDGPAPSSVCRTCS